MPYCPQCRTEYRPGFVECADCRVALVSVLPPPPPPHAEAGHAAPDYSKYVAVLDTTDNFALNAATELLEEAQIPYLVSNEPKDVKREVLAGKHKWWILPCRVFVDPEFEKEARELLDAFANPEILDPPQEGESR